MTMQASPFAGFYGMDGQPVAVRDSAIAWKTIMGIPQTSDNIDEYASLEALANAPADEAWVYACVAARYRAAESVRMRVYIRDGQDLVPQELQPTYAGQDLQHLIDNVNGIDMTGSEFRGYTQASRTVWGGCGWKKVRGTISKTTKELYWLRAPDLTPHSQNGRFVDGWQYHPRNSAHEIIAPADILIFRSFNMASQIDFLSPLSAARYNVQVNRGAAMNNASTLRNGGVPIGMFAPTKGSEITKADKSAIVRFIRQFRGPKNAGKALFSGDIEYRPLALSPRDADWINAGKISRMAVSAVTGVPLLVAGDDDKASVYANFRDANVAFWRGTMEHELKADGDVITNWLAPEFSTPGKLELVVAPDLTTVEALKPTFQEQVTAWSSWSGDQVVVPNEVRAYFRLGGPVPWGDKPTPKTAINLRPDPATISLSLPVESDATTPVAPVGEQPILSPGDDQDVADSMRSFGKRLYRQDAVKAYTTMGGPLNTLALFGSVVPDATRSVIEDGLRRRLSAEQIADALTLRAPLQELQTAEPMQIHIHNYPFDPKADPTNGPVRADTEATHHAELLTALGAQADAIRSMPAPVVNIAPQPITVNVPEQPAPIVNVAPELRVPATTTVTSVARNEAGEIVATVEKTAVTA